MSILVVDLVEELEIIVMITFRKKIFTEMLDKSFLTRKNNGWTSYLTSIFKMNM